MRIAEQKVRIHSPPAVSQANFPIAPPARPYLVECQQGLGERHTHITAWLDENCGADGWAMTPSGTVRCCIPRGSAQVKPSGGAGMEKRNPAGLPAGQHRRSSAWPAVFGAEFFELCPHRHKPAREDTDDLTADLGRREGGSVYKPTPTIDLILRADDDFIGIAIHGDKALGFLNLLHQFVDCHGLGLHCRPPPGCAGLRGCVDLGW